MTQRSLFDTQSIPFGWPEVKLTALAYLAISAVGIALGLVLTEILVPIGLGDIDSNIADWFVAQRSPSLNTWSDWGSGLADTPIVMGAVVLLVALFLLIRRRWAEPLVLLVSIVLEVLTFLTITYVASRSRPDVERLDPSPPTSSFPSGHTAAAVVLWVGLALLVGWQFRNEIARWVLLAIGSLAAVAVALSRMYRGMHHLSDVIAGVLLGAVALTVAIVIVRRGQRDLDEEPISALDGLRSPRTADSHHQEKQP